MIDLHTHILPGVDDGAADIYDTLEMAELAVSNGVTAIVATPHCNIPGLYDNYYDDEYIRVFQEVEQALEKEGIPLTLYPGMEVFVTEQIPELLYDGRLMTINAGHYLLVEFSFDEYDRFAERMLREIRDLGLCPVIAHPERYEFVKENIQHVSKWLKMGCKIQINKGSLMGRFGSQAFHMAHEMLKHNWVTAVASDAHSPFYRTPNLQDVYEELLMDYTPDYLHKLFFENPMRICMDQPTL